MALNICDCLTWPRLPPTLVSLRFTYCNERPGEGQHAKTHRRGLGKPNRTEQYQSLNLRLPEMEAGMLRDARLFDHMALLCGRLRNPLVVSSALGLKLHPQLAVRSDGSTQMWAYNTLHAQVVYHADAFTLYSAPPPVVDAPPPPGPPARPPPGPPPAPQPPPPPPEGNDGI